MRIAGWVCCLLAWTTVFLVGSDSGEAFGRAGPGAARGLLSDNFQTSDKIVIGTSMSLSQGEMGLNTADYIRGLPPSPGVIYS
jgi:hypothetical protein